MLHRMVRRFISEIKRDGLSDHLTNVRRTNMVVIDLGYRSVVLSTEDAIRIAEILAKTETFEEKYRTKEEKERSGIDDDYTYHVYPQDKPFNMKIISDSHYQMAKLAGKPVKG
jgi:hypothetical protein